jgi:lysophospholipid acyltransferase (LPLAT)-like uncharacterized protein
VSTLKHIYKNFVRKFLALPVISVLVYLYIWIVFLTSSKVVRYSPGSNAEVVREHNFLYVFWHNRLMMIHMMPVLADKISILISTHADGKVIGMVSKLFGRKVIWGSSTRGWVDALKKILSILKCGESVVITPDGPRGPAQQINSAVVKISAKSGVGILPVTYGSRRKKLLRSWDKFILPLPFSKLSFVYGRPIILARNAPSSDIAGVELALKRELDRISVLADKLVS